MIVVDYVADRVFEIRADYEKCKWCCLPAQDGAGKLTTKRGMYPFVDAVGERSYLSG